jgi:hypothetical protein
VKEAIEALKAIEPRMILIPVMLVVVALAIANCFRR